MYYDEIPADSKEAAAEFFVDHMREDVSLIRVVFVRPNEGGVREYSRRPDSPTPFRPLVARRKIDKDENV